jgi:1,4-alpha-glucan branching enzyme
VHFKLDAPSATSVCVAGSFNDWEPSSKPLHPDGGGCWTKETSLPPGTYEYCLVVDGHWMPDPAARESVPNPFGGRNSVLHVGGPLGATHLTEASTLPLRTPAGGRNPFDRPAR